MYFTLVVYAYYFIGTMGKIQLTCMSTSVLAFYNIYTLPRSRSALMINLHHFDANKSITKCMKHKLS